MMFEVDRALLYQAIECWGCHAQPGMLFEEMGELITAMNKFTRCSTSASFDRMIEEVADVEIMLAQLRLIFNEPDSFYYHLVAKQDRLRERITVEKAEHTDG